MHANTHTHTHEHTYFHTHISHITYHISHSAQTQTTNTYASAITPFQPELEGLSEAMPMVDSRCSPPLISEPRWLNALHTNERGLQLETSKYIWVPWVPCLQNIYMPCQEGVGSITFGRHVSNQLKIIYSESWCRELSIGIYMSRIGGGGGPGGPRMFWTPPPKVYWVTPTKF